MFFPSGCPAFIKKTSHPRQRNSSVKDSGKQDISYKLSFSFSVSEGKTKILPSKTAHDRNSFYQSILTHNALLSQGYPFINLCETL